MDVSLLELGTMPVTPSASCLWITNIIKSVPSGN
jgi:hypothetical protein